MIGAYGEWAAHSIDDPPRLSFRQPMFASADAWRPVARARFRELLLGPGGAATPVASVEHRLEFDGLSIEHLHWQLPYGTIMAETNTSGCGKLRACRKIRTR